MAVSNDSQYKVIGTRPIRHDGVDKVTGRAVYGADIRMPGMLPGAILRSPHAHAKIRSIDTSAAQHLPGVRAIVTHEDLPEQGERIVQLGEGATSMRHLSANVLARTKVLYVGHAVAAIAADSIHQAQAAIEKIKVEYEVLPPVMDVVEAMSPDAPVLNEDVFTDSIGKADDEKPTQPSNVAQHLRLEKGDLDQGFRDADIVVEEIFTTSMVHQGYIEPHNATAHWNADGRITVWMSTQGAFTARQQTAELLRVPVSSVKVIPLEIGGGFGGKISVYLPPIAAALSKKSGRPVQLQMSRTEVLQATGPTPGSVIKLKLGATNEGKLTAGKAWIAFEAGAYPGSPVNMACQCVFACYDFPHAQVDGYDVCVNRPRTNAYRAPGSTQVAFAIESLLDRLSRRLGMEPIEIRQINSSREGTRRVDGPTFSRIGMLETVEAIRDCQHFGTPLQAPGDGQTGTLAAPHIKRGRGVASGFWFNAGMQSSVTATVNFDGTVSLIEGSTDIGGTRTSLAMQLAETLGISAEAINPQVADTDSVGYTDVTGGSRVTFSTGIAVIEAGRNIQQEMIRRAAKMWRIPAEELRYETGSVTNGNGKTISFEELAAKLPILGGSVSANGKSGGVSQGGAFGTHVVDVEVDMETGKVQILRYTASQDAGTAIHPAYVEGQIQGGVVQGIGWALNEAYCYDPQGDLRNATFLDYRMPTCYDVPMIETIIVEVPDPNHPYGVRGVGEVPICPPPAAIANAIFDATGVAIRELPMSPPAVLNAIKSHGSQ